MDNLRAHKGTRVKEMIEERGWQFLYLPAYSPDLNPMVETRKPSRRSTIDDQEACA